MQFLIGLAEDNETDGLCQQTHRFIVGCITRLCIIYEDINFSSIYQKLPTEKTFIRWNSGMTKHIRDYVFGSPVRRRQMDYHPLRFFEASSSLKLHFRLPSVVSGVFLFLQAIGWKKFILHLCFMFPIIKIRKRL